MPQKKVVKQKISEIEAKAEAVLQEKANKDDLNQPLYITRV